MAQQPPHRRIVSIDALRGFDMFWIVGGGAFISALLTRIGGPVCHALNAQLEHCPWTGFTFEDLIFPLFLFLAGASMPFSLSRRLERGDSRRDLYLHIFRRALILYLLGMVYNGLLDLHFDQLRFTGVLHRIAFTYLIGGIIVMNASVRGQALWTGGLLLGYWAVMALAPVPGVGIGSFAPDANLADFVDRFLLPGVHRSYGLNRNGDALGVLSTFPAAASLLIGVLAGHRLRAGNGSVRVVRDLAFAGAGSLVLGLAWGLVFPINTLLWTSSYVVFAGGWSLLLLALFHWLIDIRGYRAWAFPFVVIGMNAITIYLTARLIDFRIIARPLAGGLARLSGDWGVIVLAFAVLAAQWLFLWFLYRRKLFLKV